MPKPVIEKEEFANVCSLTHFYNISYSDKQQPQQAVVMTMPLPLDYCGRSLYVMLRHQDDDDDNDDKAEEDFWEILEKNPDVHCGMVNVNVVRFSQ